ncbi:MAG: 50S ribosomal protein L29 [Candidatus Micrarchaeota archaeon]|nr:50S ribosomal protein L29 [Candidatus Micrarchaeota archaeon]
MRIKELRAMSAEMLKGKLQQLTLDLSIEKRKIAATGVQSKKVKVREMRRARAQILTLLKEKGVSN